ncbi:MAG: PD-(D/E)XK nuclease family protein [Elusimicrobiaceae bacterium]|nr:PD-(D/E)XK nuclease family protein [Elusimicrobiaceae bacterium]
MYNDVHELNFSKIKTYLECPLLYKYKYIDGRKEGLVAASSLGVSIHRTLEQYHRHSNDPSELLAYYDDCWLGAGYKSAAEQMEYYLKGKQQLEKYAEREYARKTTVDSTEREFIFTEGKWTLRGKIDRTDKHPDGSWEVIDYKTGDDIDLEAQITDSLQMGIYAIGAQRAWNIKKGKASFYFTAFDKVVSAPFEAFDEAKILGKFIEVGQKIEAEQFEPDTSHCATCAFRNRCEKSICPDEEKEPDFSGNTPA